MRELAVGRAVSDLLVACLQVCVERSPLVLHVSVSVELRHYIFVGHLETLQLVVQLFVVLGQSLAVLFNRISFYL